MYQSYLEVVRSRASAELLLHPLRLQVLEHARDPASASEIARRVGVPPQRLNYHLGALATAGLARLVEERRRRNLVERLYQSSAQYYTIGPAALGPLGSAAARASGSRFSAARLLGLTALVQDELGDALSRSGRAADGDAVVPTLSLDTEVELRSAEERAAFADALRRAVAGVVDRYAPRSVSPADSSGAQREQRFRLVLGCYPLPGAGPGPTSGDEDDHDDR